MEQWEENELKQRMRNAMLQAFQSYTSYIQVRKYTEIASKFYLVEFDVNGHIRVTGLYSDELGTIWLDSGSIFSFLIQPTLQKFSREHPWLLGV